MTSGGEILSSSIPTPMKRSSSSSRMALSLPTLDPIFLNTYGEHHGGGGISIGNLHNAIRLGYFRKFGFSRVVTPNLPPSIPDEARKMYDTKGHAYALGYDQSHGQIEFDLDLEMSDIDITYRPLYYGAAYEGTYRKYAADMRIIYSSSRYRIGFYGHYENIDYSESSAEFMTDRLNVARFCFGLFIGMILTIGEYRGLFWSQKPSLGEVQIPYRPAGRRSPDLQNDQNDSEDD